MMQFSRAISVPHMHPGSLEKVSRAMAALWLLHGWAAAAEIGMRAQGRNHFVKRQLYSRDTSLPVSLPANCFLHKLLLPFTSQRIPKQQWASYHHHQKASQFPPPHPRKSAPFCSE